MLAAMFGGHALFTISDRTFERMVEANNGRTGFHIHVSEGMNDVYDSLQNYGRRPVAAPAGSRASWAKRPSSATASTSTPPRWSSSQTTDTMVVNNPESNMGNAVGICPVLQLYRHGILLGMGTDAYTNDMLESLKVALCCPAPATPACRTSAGARSRTCSSGTTRRSAQSTSPTQLGVLKPGAAADIIVMDYKPFTPFSDENIDGHMIFGMTGRQCQTTIAAGKTPHDATVSSSASTRRPRTRISSRKPRSSGAR